MIVGYMPVLVMDNFVGVKKCPGHLDRWIVKYCFGWRVAHRITSYILFRTTKNRSEEIE